MGSIVDWRQWRASPQGGQSRQVTGSMPVLHKLCVWGLAMESSLTINGAGRARWRQQQTAADGVKYCDVRDQMWWIRIETNDARRALRYINAMCAPNTALGIFCAAGFALINYVCLEVICIWIRTTQHSPLHRYLTTNNKPTLEWAIQRYNNIQFFSSSCQFANYHFIINCNQKAISKQCMGHGQTFTKYLFWLKHKELGNIL